MLVFVAAVVVATSLTGLWCAADIAYPRIRACWRAGKRITASAVSLGVVIAIGASLRFWLVPPHHAMYLDEPWYAEAACNLARLRGLVLCEDTWSGPQCVPYGKALGWPVLLSPSMLVFGCDTMAGVTANQVIGTATLLLIAVATRCLGGRWWQGAIAAAILAVHPVHVAWSATGETNVSAAAMLIAGACGVLANIRTGRMSGAALGVSALAMATAIRPESLAPALVSAVGITFLGRATQRERLWVAGGIVTACAAAALSGLQLWAMNEAISAGAFLSLANIRRNALLIAGGESLIIQAIVVPAAFAGAAILARSPKGAIALMLVLMATAAALVPLAYDRFDERMLLGATVLLVPLIGFAFDWLFLMGISGRARLLLRPIAGVVFVLVVSLLWRRALLSAAISSETEVLETRIVKRLSDQRLPAHSLFITEQPTILAATGIRHVMSTEQALHYEGQLTQVIQEGRPVYFLRDMYCEPGFQGADRPPLCDKMLTDFKLSPVVEESRYSRTYALYRVFPLADDLTHLYAP